MVGDDFASIRSMYDLKGSLFDRLTDLTEEEKESGESGLKVLKDQNIKTDETSLEISEQ